MRKTLVLLAALALLLVGLVAPAEAGRRSKPFVGYAIGEATWSIDAACEDVNPFGLRTDSTGEGHALWLGSLTMSSEHCTPVAEEVSGEMVFVAANGDEVHLDYEGTSPLVEDLVLGEVFTLPLHWVIRGGTGRFDDARGRGEMVAISVFAGTEVEVQPAIWYWTGRIRP